ncbi:hypothetical protein [Pelagicoccus albus]|uniref:Uncharacterized protein n=1 Tax=Pelagicoccus albus TaxID=415222 RepID=A0A7X1E7R8_9BACT|nr:hypothetical protein [Pelagicoccus albus]MBC2605481.1 hypothetical protein [Pelagicoccus albus]
MNADHIIQEIVNLPAEERRKVIDFVRNLVGQQFEEEQIKIAQKRIEEYDMGLEKAVHHEEAIRLLRKA